MYWFIIVIVIIILIGYPSYKYGQSICEINNIFGFCESPPEFNKESGIDICTVYIGEKVNGEYTSYILMVDDDGDNDDLLINEPCKFTLSESTFSDSKDCREFQMIFSEFESKLWPSKMIMRYYPYTNKIVLNDDEKIYMILYKNPILTELEQFKKENQSNCKDSNTIGFDEPIDKSNYSKDDEITDIP
jgi:hypothetical protein